MFVVVCAGRWSLVSQIKYYYPFHIHRNVLMLVVVCAGRWSLVSHVGDISLRGMVQKNQYV